MYDSYTLTALVVQDPDGNVGTLAGYSAVHDQLNCTSRHLS
jgi:hypothetical protein